MKHIGGCAPRVSSTKRAYKVDNFSEPPTCAANIWCSSFLGRGEHNCLSVINALGFTYWSMIIIYGGGHLELRGKPLSGDTEVSPLTLINARRSMDPKPLNPTDRH